MMVMDLLVVTERAVGTIITDTLTPPNLSSRRQDTEYTTRRAGPQCVLKNKHTR